MVRWARPAKLTSLRKVRHGREANLQGAFLRLGAEASAVFLGLMPASASIKLAIEAAIQAANAGHQHMEESGPVFDITMTAAAAAKHLGGTLLKAHKTGAGDAFWYVPARAECVTKTGTGEHKVSIVQSGNDGNGTATKLSDMRGGEWSVTHAVRAVLTSSQGAAGAEASLFVTGIPATLTPKAGAQLTHLVLSVGGAASELPVEDALKAAGLSWRPWNGCTAKEAIVPAGDGLPDLAGARVKAVNLITIAGSDDFRAQTAVQALGIASTTSQSSIGDVANIIASWAGYADAADAMAVILASVAATSARCAKAHAAARALVTALRSELAALTSEQMAEVAKLRSQLTSIGLAPSGVHIGAWLQGLAAPATVLAPTGLAAGPQAAMPPIAPAGTTTAVTACQAEATRRVATFGGLSDATKATMVAALTAQLLAEGWGAAAVAVATAGLDPLRIVGAESLPPTQVFAEISKAINKSVPEVLTSISVERGSTADEGSAMFMSAERVAERAADDLRFMAEHCGTKFEAKPTSWGEGAQRVGEIMSAFARARKVTDGAPSAESASTRLVKRLSSSEDEHREVSKIFDAKGVVKGTSTAASLLNPLTTESFLRKESMANRESDELKEVHRLCAYDGDEGRACEAHILSDGKSNGSMANKGEVPPSVVSARENLASLIEDTTETFMGESLTGKAASDEVARFATSVVTANISTADAVKLLGARKDTKATVGGRIVMSGARFGSMTGAHPRATCALGRPRRHAHPPHTLCTRAWLPEAPRSTSGWGATAALHACEVRRILGAELRV